MVIKNFKPGTIAGSILQKVTVYVYSMVETVC